jgi:hypothetical protein
MSRRGPWSARRAGDAVARGLGAGEGQHLMCRIMQLVTIVFRAVFGSPHWWRLHPIQLFPGRTLRRVAH